MRVIFNVVLMYLLVGALAALPQSAASSDNGGRVVRVGVAEPYNQSAAVFQPSWERDQLVRDINRDGHKKKSELAIEAVPLHGSSMDEVAAEARKQNCAYVILTTATGTSAGAGVDSQHGVTRIPGSIGNTTASPDLMINYEIQRTGEPQPFARGSVLAHGTDYQGQTTSDWNNSVREAMDRVAPLVIKELQRHPAPQPD